jgi:hypothetical protein
MKIKNLVENSTNRAEFNRAYKSYLERKGKISCSRCKYHRGENDKREWYGCMGDDIKYSKQPNWKLTSKKRKQWMKNIIKIITTSNAFGRNYIEFNF